MRNSLSHIRFLTLLILAITFVFTAFAGCADTTDSPTGTTPTAAPTPTPTPKVGLDAVFGRERITIEVISNGSEEDSALFFEGAQAEAESLGVTLSTNAAGSGFDAAVSNAAKNGADAVIAGLIEDQSNYSAINAAAGKDIPITVFEMRKSDAPASVSHIYYNPDNEADLAFDAALNFPPHDTPVRLILMFESKESESYLLYQQLYDEGKIFPKEIYIASEEEKTAGEWLTAKLDGYIEGMLDGVYAEDTALALSALDAIEALSRTDMEVFCPGVTSVTVERMANNAEVFAQAAGANTYLAGALSVRAALKGLKGEGSVTLELQPTVINASDLAENGVQALIDFYGETAATWNESWMDVLREYYGTTK